MPTPAEQMEMEAQAEAEAMFLFEQEQKKRTSPLSALGEAGPVQGPRIPGNTTTDEMIDFAKGTGALGLEVGGGIAANALVPGLGMAPYMKYAPRVMKYVAPALIEAGGAFLGREAAEGMGWRERQTPGQEIGNYALDAGLGMGVPAALDTAATFINAVRKPGGRIPKKAEILYQESQLPGITGAVQNAPRTTIDKERMLVDDIIASEETYVRLDPTKGINPNAPDAYQTYKDRVDKMLTDAKRTKLKIYNQAEKIVLYNKERVPKFFLPENIVFGEVVLDTGEKIPLSDLMSPAARDVLRRKYDEIVPFDRTGGGYLTERREFTPKEALGAIRQLDARLEDLKYYDDSFQAKVTVDPSELAKKQPEIDAIKHLRKVLNQELNTYVDSLFPGNDSGLNATNQAIHALIDYGNLAGRFSTETLQGIAPGSGRSLINKTGQNSRGVVIESMDFLSNGAISKNQHWVDRGQNLIRGPQALEELQGVMAYKAGKKAPFSIDRDVLPHLYKASLPAMYLDNMFFDPNFEAHAQSLPISPETKMKLTAAKTQGRDERIAVLGQVQIEMAGQPGTPPSPIDGINSYIPDPANEGTGIVPDLFERAKVRSELDKIPDAKERVMMKKALNKDRVLLKIPDYLKRQETPGATPDVLIEQPQNSISKAASGIKSRKLVTVDLDTDLKRIEHDF